MNQPDPTLRGMARFRAAQERDNAAIEGDAKTLALRATLKPLAGLHGRTRLMVSFENGETLRLAALPPEARTVNALHAGRVSKSILLLANEAVMNARLARPLDVDDTDDSGDGDDDIESKEVNARTGQAPDAVTVPESRAPKSILVLSWGTRTSGSGFITVNQDSIAPFLANQKQLGLLKVPLLLPAVAITQVNGQEEIGAPEEIAAMGTVSISQDNGISLDGLEWTPAGLNALLEYSELVPSVWVNDGRIVVALRSVSLSKRDGVSAEAFPRFLQLSAGPSSTPPLRGRARVVAAFAAANARHAQTTQH